MILLDQINPDYQVQINLTNGGVITGTRYTPSGEYIILTVQKALSDDKTKMIITKQPIHLGGIEKIIVTQVAEVRDIPAEK